MRNAYEGKSKYAWALAGRCPRKRRRHHPRRRSWKGFASPRSCKTGTPCSLIRSGKRGVVEAHDHRSKAFAIAKLLSELVRCILAGNPAHADAIESPFANLGLLNK